MDKTLNCIVSQINRILPVRHTMVGGSSTEKSGWSSDEGSVRNLLRGLSVPPGVPRAAAWPERREFRGWPDKTTPLSLPVVNFRFLLDCCCWSVDITDVLLGSEELESCWWGSLPTLKPLIGGDRESLSSMSLASLPPLKKKSTKTYHFETISCC